MAKYKVHTFLSSNNFTISSLSNNPFYNTIEYLSVAGGGGAGTVPLPVPEGGPRSGNQAGGGAGGLLLGNTTLSASTHIVTVGAGGGMGSPGSNTFISSGPGQPTAYFVSFGGGRGADNSPTGPGIFGQPGGSGGGAAAGLPTSPPWIGEGVPGQGNPGGARIGGGAGAPGVGNPKGFGRYVDINGSNTYYSEGGWVSSSGNRDQNTGHGGHTAPTTPAYAGGSGIVIIRYPVVPQVQSKVSRVSNIIANVSETTSGELVEFTITTVNAANGEVLYYSTNNQPNAAFEGGNTGSFTVNGNVGTVTLSISSGGLDEEFFDLQVRRGSPFGALLRQGGNVLIDLPTYVEATGGLIEDSGGYRIHVFTTSGDFEVLNGPEGASNIEVILIGGGGGGGAGGDDGSGYKSGGGGAGGFFTTTITNISPGTYPIIIGGGGNRGNTYSYGGTPESIGGLGRQGGNTTGFGYTALGGGGGGGLGFSPPALLGPTGTGASGGSGGGGSFSGPPSSFLPGGAGITWDGVVQGYPGAQSGQQSPPAPGYNIGGGGGGAGQAGRSHIPTGYVPGLIGIAGRGGRGGNGLPVVWLSNVNYGTPGPGEGRWFAGGGGGQAGGNPTWARQVDWLPYGGIGGGGSGSMAQNWAPTGGNVASWYRLESWGDGNVNTGGGGGGSPAFAREPQPAGGRGGSGIAIIRYPVSLVEPEYIQASGGIESVSDGYKSHVFLSSNTFSITSLGSSPTYNVMDYLIVGGGGASANASGPSGGGGGGGVLTGSKAVTLYDLGTYTATVGAGGAFSSSGGNSSIFSNLAIGGGAGGFGLSSPTAGKPGGSGGGVGGALGTPAGTAGGSGTTGQGYPGGTRTYPSDGSTSGGGGAGEAGGNLVGPSPAKGSYGGNGISIPWVSPSYGTGGLTPGRWFGGGGGGATYNSPPRNSGPGGAGGFGGGGYGGFFGPGPVQAGSAGNVNTGGGGGGGISTSGSIGGSGIIIIRYPYE